MEGVTLRDKIRIHNVRSRLNVNPVLKIIEANQLCSFRHVVEKANNRIVKRSVVDERLW